jgi:bifunctional polynucleotide phosphatase/kinase
MENFFKRKDPPPGAPAGGPNPKTACTSSTSPSSSSAPRWSTHHDALLARTEAACAPCAKIAAFDLDDTLQKTRSGQKGYMVTDVNDFVDWSADVAPTLRRLHATGYKIVIFSNQGGVKGAMTGKRADVVRRRIDAFARAAGVPLQAFCATQKGVDKDPRSYRKPGAGMWKLATSAAFNDGVEVNVAECFFVGDAAGRAGDFSASDKEFAAGAGVRFMTPEEAFNAPGCAPAGPGGGGGREDGEGAAEDANTKMESAVCAKEGGEGVIVIDDDDDEVDKKMASLRDDTP